MKAKLPDDWINDMRQIAQPIFDRWGVTHEAVAGRNRRRRMAIIRKEIVKALHAESYTLAEIGAFLDRDHSTIKYYLEEP